MTFILIDDDPVVTLIHRKIIEITCKELTPEITSFSSSLEALNFMRDRENYDPVRPYLILLDINMPGLNGWEFLEHIDSLPIPWNNIYILSSSIAKFDMERAKRYSSVKGYLAKPLSRSSLKDIVLKQ